MNLLVSINKIKSFLDGKEILVAYGGRSSEKNASFKTGQRIAECLERNGINTRLVDPENRRSELIAWASKSGLVFLGLHGGYGEDGTIQGLLDYYHIPYTGSGILGSCIGMNKLVTKRILTSVNIPTADFVVWNEMSSTLNFINESETKLGYPMMMKILDEGSGNGVFLVKDREEFIYKLSEIKILNKVFVEKYIKGRELSVGVIEEDGELVVLPILEVIYDGDFFDLKIRSNPRKYQKNIPAKLSGDIEERIKSICRQSYKVLGASVYSRIDIRLEEKTNIPYILEITTLPGLTESSWIPEMAEIGRVSFDELIFLIILATIDKYDC